MSRLAPAVIAVGGDAIGPAGGNLTRTPGTGGTGTTPGVDGSDGADGTVVTI
jgi:hypothetical protein